jgi:hypothetical protein
MKFALIFTAIEHPDIDGCCYFPSILSATEWLADNRHRVNVWELIDEATDDVVDMGRNRHEG